MGKGPYYPFRVRLYLPFRQLAPRRASLTEPFGISPRRDVPHGSRRSGGAPMNPWPLEFAIVFGTVGFFGYLLFLLARDVLRILDSPGMRLWESK